MDGVIYGCLTLQAQGTPIDLSKLLPLADMKVDMSNHLSLYTPERANWFDYLHGGLNTESHKAYVPARGMTISGYRVGVDTEDNLTRKVIQNLLTMNSDSDVHEQSTFLGLAHTNLYLKTQGRFIMSLDISSQRSKFLLMSRDMQLNMLAFCNSNQSNLYLMWTNEQNIENRMQSIYGEEFYYYRIFPILNSTCIIHSQYLMNKVKKWQRVLRDPLKIFNALDSHLHRKSLGSNL